LRNPWFFGIGRKGEKGEQTGLHLLRWISHKKASEAGENPWLAQIDYRNGNRKCQPPCPI
jgi:hypothetical protein